MKGHRLRAPPVADMVMPAVVELTVGAVNEKLHMAAVTVVTAVKTTLSKEHQRCKASAFKVE